MMEALNPLGLGHLGGFASYLDFPLSSLVDRLDWMLLCCPKSIIFRWKYPEKKSQNPIKVNWLEKERLKSPEKSQIPIKVNWLGKERLKSPEKKKQAKGTQT